MKSRTSMLIGLISDTHLGQREKLPKEVFEIFKGVNLILHAGDILDLNVIKQLKRIAPVKAVYGNMDPRSVKEQLPKINSVKIFNRKIGIVHDAGIFSLSKAREIAAKNNFNVLVFGHTHKAVIKKANKVLFINPGSPVNPFPFTKPSVGLLKITRGSIYAEIVKI